MKKKHKEEEIDSVSEKSEAELGADSELEESEDIEEKKETDDWDIDY